MVSHSASKEIVPDTVYSTISKGDDSFSAIYVLEEPEIDSNLISRLRAAESRIFSEEDKVGDVSKNIRNKIELIIETLDGENSRSKDDGRAIRYFVEREVLGFGKINGFLLDGDIEDISCDGPGVPVFVYHRNYGYIPTNVVFETESELEYFIRKIVQRSKKHISASNPVIDATLPGGSRLQASLGKYVTSKGSSFTIRKFREKPMSPVDMIRSGVGSSRMFAYLWLITEYGANIMVTGGTASGKTTFLNSMLIFTPPDKKIVTIEDTRELNLQHDNWLPMVTRAGFGYADPETGKYQGEIDMFDLLSVSLRHRPNYIVVGEVRGREAYTIFQAMSVGRYALATFHAEDVDMLIHRLESKPISIPRTLLTSLDVVATQALMTVNNRVIRVVKNISEINGLDGETHEIIVNKLFDLKQNSNEYSYSGFSYVINRIAQREGSREAELEKEVDIRKRVLDRMTELNINDYFEVSKIIKRYYRDRENVLSSLGIE